MARFKLVESPSFTQLLELRKKPFPTLDVLLNDSERCSKLFKEWNGVVLDLTRQRLDVNCLDLLLSLAEELNIAGKISGLFDGSILNKSEGRSVLHTALRAPKGAPLEVNGENVLKHVHQVLGNIETFSQHVRSGKHVASDGEPFKSLLCVGIGGSFLGTAFTSDAFLGNEKARAAAVGRTIRFLSNVDPAGFRLATEGLDANRTMVVIISKTFTTTETMKNAQAVKKWLLENIQNPKDVGKHLCAISTNLKLTKNFGIDDSQVFGFWDWVGGRFSVSSAVGILPLALHFGYSFAKDFLDGCYAMDEHFKTTQLADNLPVLLGLASFYNSAILGFNTVAVVPYSQDLNRFPNYVQQLAMESNGKSVDEDGTPLTYDAGEIFFGEAGTNGQHSFYQLLHQGRTVPTEFIGFIKTGNEDFETDGVLFHEELMANFFAQPDALAYGISKEKLKHQDLKETLVPHKVCGGNRPSAVILFNELCPFNIGVLVSLYEHRTAVQGFLLGINSFDQMGVELGKVLATDIRKILATKKRKWEDAAKPGQISASTVKLLNKFTNYD